MTTARPRDRGFTLIELVIAITVAAVVVTPVMISFVEGINGATEAYKVQLGVFLAQDLMEEVRTRKFDEDTPGGGGVVAAVDINLGRETGENAGGPRSAWDDVDDYDGWSSLPPKDMNGASLTDFAGYTRTVTVEYVEAADPETPVVGPTDYKRVTVSVSWDAGARSVRLRMVVANY